MSPRLAPVNRRILIRRLRQLGFEGPWPGGSHEYMTKGNHLKVWIPNPHGGVIGVGLLAKVLKQADVSRSDWFRT